MSTTEIAPDPCAGVLPALAALGALASIAAVAWAAEDSASERTPDSKRRAGLAMQELETCSLGLSEIFRRFQRLFEAPVADRRRQAAPMKFGIQGGRVSDEHVGLYNRLINDTAAMLVLASENAGAVMRGVENGAIDPSEAVMIAFGECQDELNQLLATRATLQLSIEKGIELSDRLTALIREMRLQHGG